MRADGNITEHLQRFAPGGKYWHFALKDYRVVHFKMAPWQPSPLTLSNSKYMAVIVAADCKTAKIVMGQRAALEIAFKL